MSWPAPGWYRSCPVTLLLLALLGAASADVVCLEAGVCTPVTRLGKTGDVERVRHTERLPARIEPGAPFGGWMTWPGPPRRCAGGSSSASRWSSGRSSPPQPCVSPSPRAWSPSPVTRVSWSSSRPTRSPAGPSPPSLPEAMAGAETLELLTPAQRSEVARWRAKAKEWQSRLASTWSVVHPGPADAAARTELLDTFAAEPVTSFPSGSSPRPSAASCAAVATRSTGASWWRTSRADAYRLRVEGVPLDQLVEDWNSGLHGLVGRLERVPRPRFQVRRGHRHDEVSFTLDVRSDVDETRVSQVARRLAEIPGLEPGGADLPPPGL